MSKVYQAYDHQLGRTICLKILDKEKTAKFRRERLQGAETRQAGEGEACMSCFIIPRS